MDPIILSPLGTPPPAELGTRIHPFVRAAAAGSWTAGQYAEAVERARRAAVNAVRDMTSRFGETDEELMADAFALEGPTAESSRVRLYLVIDEDALLAPLHQRIKQSMLESAIRMASPVDLTGYRGSPRDGEWRVALANIEFVSDFVAKLDECVLVVE